jgi:hypothetical protein
VGHPKYDECGKEGNGERGHAEEGVSLFRAP